MSETKNPGEKKLGVKMTLRPRTETGVVRQSFSHGRSKQVVVEKVKRRSIGGAPEAKAEPAPVEAPKRAEKVEIANWFRIWLETPDAFFDWLDVRKQSPEFREKFPQAGLEE